MVVGDEEVEEDEEESVVRRPRRHVFEDLEIVDDRIEGFQDEARVSVCIPPKNALLLMRCRSDPMKNEDLTNRTWEPAVATNEEEDEEFVDCENQIEKDMKEQQQQQVMVLDQEIVQVEGKQCQEQTNVQEDEANHDEAEDHNNGVLERESEVKERSEQVLPECLLMMMHEPKLSLNVSKETWVCSTDFIKRPSNRRKPPAPPTAIKPVGEDGGTATVRVADGGFPAVLRQPARLSCSLPMATVLEQKLANAVGYEPFVLTRCKSEPMKTAASKLLPESCVWENRKLERLSRATFGVGAAGLGF
ncbi:hypothetical protein E3N88_05419 [Mikania micrantha]|uniref:Uncharacterized protein n=1 Tax=Mikania micrantha TaxID=192012 RepID=A0A5N6PKW0_9ASTR|nr:hypothetical protein E3N88_05419 [Mikania micrantha]